MTVTMNPFATPSDVRARREAALDTKVVQRGRADGCYICTTGVGQLVDDAPAGPAAARPGDAVLACPDQSGAGAVAGAAERAGGRTDAAACGRCAGAAQGAVRVIARAKARLL